MLRASARRGRSMIPRSADLQWIEPWTRVRDVPVKAVFMCEFCGARPDEETYSSLRRQMLDLRFGEYVDAEPGRRGTDRARRLARSLGSTFGSP